MWLLFGLLASALWSASDIFNSILVKHYERNPIILSWIQSVGDLLILFVTALLFDVQSEWIGALMFGGFTTYIAFLFLFHVLHRVDVSVMNASWAFLAIFVSISGFVFFGESWSIIQTAGVLLVLSSVFFLAYWHQHVSIFRTIFLLVALGFLYAPVNVVMKAALLNGETVPAAFFWTLLGAKGSAFLFPWMTSKLRRTIVDFNPHLSMSFLFLNAMGLICSLSGFVAITKAYAVGMASLVSVTENAQPFFAILFAWLSVKMCARYAPRELLTAQSVGVKIACFLVVFAGLGMLAVG